MLTDALLVISVLGIVTMAWLVISSIIVLVKKD